MSNFPLLVVFIDVVTSSSKFSFRCDLQLLVFICTFQFVELSPAKSSFSLSIAAIVKKQICLKPTFKEAKSILRKRILETDKPCWEVECHIFIDMAQIRANYPWVAQIHEKLLRNHGVKSWKENVLTGITWHVLTPLSDKNVSLPILPISKKNINRFKMIQY